MLINAYNRAIAVYSVPMHFDNLAAHARFLALYIHRNLQTGDVNYLGASLFADKGRPTRHLLETNFQFRGIPIPIGTEY